jgi:transglutaminase-like putative cysteine protease
LSEHQVTLKINDQITAPEIVGDGFGGYWIKVPVQGLEKSSEIIVSYLRKKQTLQLYKEYLTDFDKYLEPANFIDSDNQPLKNKAIEICSGLTTNIAKADKIARFVNSLLNFSEYKDAFLDAASKTYTNQFGICINYSRLTTALCRAAGVPARTVWGIIYNQQDGIYDYHHEWTEILDNDGYWHQVDNTHVYIFDLNNINYLDLYYSPEQNTFIQEHPEYKFFLGDVRFFDGYPAALSGRLNGFNLLENNQPESMLVEFKYQLNQ